MQNVERAYDEFRPREKKLVIKGVIEGCLNSTEFNGFICWRYLPAYTFFLTVK